jgi:hypothetical protein
MPLFPMILRTLTISLLLSPVVLFGLIADVHLSAAQIAPSRKDEADRLLEQGRQQYFNRQHEAAEQSWKKSLAVYRAIRNQNGLITLAYHSTTTRSLSTNKHYQSFASLNNAME